MPLFLRQLVHEKTALEANLCLNAGHDINKFQLNI